MCIPGAEAGARLGDVKETPAKLGLDIKEVGMEINQRREKWVVGARTHGVWGRKEKGSKRRILNVIKCQTLEELHIIASQITCLGV